MSGSADATATFAVDLESNAGEVAPAAANELQALRDQIRGGIDELRGMQTAMRNLKGSGAVASSAIAELKDKITAQRAAVGQQQARYLQLGGSFRKLKPAANESVAGLRELLGAVQASGGPLQGLAGRLGNVRAILAAGAIPGGIVAIAAAMAALTVAAGAAVVALARYGFAQADARRGELLRLEGLSKTRNYWLAAAGFTRVADKAEFLQGVIDQVSDSVALGRDKLVDYAGSLYRAGLRGGNLQAALEGVSIVAATQGDAAAEAWKGWAMGAALTGQSVRALANDVKARLGGIAARQLLSLDVQTRKLKENFARIFSGIRIEGLLTAIGKITELFSQSTATGAALKALAETMLNPIADGVGSVAPIVKNFFRGMVLAALDVAIAVQSTRLWLKKTFGDPEILKGINSTAAAVALGLTAVTMLAGAVSALALPLIATGAAITVAGVALRGLVSAAKAVWAEWQQMDWAYLGDMVVKGIVNGIKGGVQWVKDAVGDVADAIQSVFAQRLRIHSPSRVMSDRAIHVDTGIAEGMRRGEPEVRRQSARIAEIPREEFAAQLPAARGATAHELRQPPGGLSALAELGGREQQPPALAQVIEMFGRPRDAATPPAAPGARSFGMREPAAAAAPARVQAQAPEMREPRLRYEDDRGGDAPSATPAARRSGGPLVVIHDLTIQAGDGGERPQSQPLTSADEASVRQQVERIFEGIAIQLGAKVA